MKVFILALVALAALVSSEPEPGHYRPRLSDVVRYGPPPFVNRPPPPSRFPRSADPQGSIVLQGQKPLSGPERRPSWNLDYQHNIWEGKNGHVSAGGGAQKLPGQRWEPHVGLQGTWRFRRSANPQGSIVLQGQQPLSGPDRRPTYNIDYQHRIYDGRDGHVSASGGAQRLPGGRWEPTVGVQASWPF